MTVTLHPFEPIDGWPYCGHVDLDKAGVGWPCDRPADEHDPAPEIVAEVEAGS